MEAEGGDSVTVDELSDAIRGVHRYEGGTSIPGTSNEDDKHRERVVDKADILAVLEIDEPKKRTMTVEEKMRTNRETSLASLAWKRSVDVRRKRRPSKNMTVRALP